MLFNRFYQPDIDLEALEVRPHVLLSTPQALRLPLRWIGILYGRVRADLAATSGIHDGRGRAQAADGRRQRHDAVLGSAAARHRAHPH